MWLNYKFFKMYVLGNICEVLLVFEKIWLRLIDISEVNVI